ncbi:MAG: serine/threonine protein kinase, partial [Myxococcales bacterium]|nr:serine/threonine protein kinase [Myxococcales bacterium]
SQPSSFAVRTLQTASGMEDFLVAGVVAEGGMGVVEFARQKSLERDVVLKRPREPDDPANVAELLREARIAGRLEHPGVVTVHGIYRDDRGHPVICMRAAPGQTWRGLQESSWDAERHARIAIEVCRALEFAHAHGVLHLDVKPSNVVVGPQGEVCLLDWGVAMDRVSEPVRTEVLGTPAYMAPEMVTLGAISERSDVYLLGGTLFHALFGRPPHRRATAATSMAAAAEPVVVPEVPPWVAELAEICGRALATDPDARFPDVKALRRALEGYLDHRSAERLAQRALLAHQLLPIGLTAQERLRELEAIRAQLRSSLALWPDNPRAKAFREDLRLSLCHLYLQLGDHEAAGRMVARMAHPPDGLEGAVEAARTAKAGRRRALHERSPRVGRAWRKRMLVRLAVIIAVTTLGGGLVQYAVQGTGQRVLVGQVVISSVAWGACLWLDPPPQAGLFERLFQNTVWAALLGLASLRLLGEVAGEPSALVMARNLVLLGALLVAHAWLAPYLVAFGGVVLAFAGGAVLAPDLARPILGVGLLVLMAGATYANDWLDRKTP